MANKWIQKVKQRMQDRGTLGAFKKQVGKVTAKTIKAAKSASNPITRKRAVLAETLMNISKKRGCK